MTSARQSIEVFEDLFEVNDLLGKIEDSGETGGPINFDLMGRLLLHAHSALDEEPDEKDAAIVQAVGLYLDAKKGQPTINMPSSLLGELIQICAIEMPNTLELQKL